MRVLIVDDDDFALDALAHALERAGHEAIRAHDGVEALERLRGARCRTVITDWEMPHMDGLELCQQIRASDLDGYVYLILLTARDTKQDLLRGLSAGADEFLCKPFDFDELCVRLRTADRILALETRELAIFAMAKLAESRDPETGEHLERMRNYSRLLAQQLVGHDGLGEEVDEAFVRLIYLTSPLHDIGKVGIPDSILLKPGRLCDAEFDVMKTHTTIGAATLGAASRRHPEVEYLRVARDIALTV